MEKDHVDLQRLADQWIHALECQHEMVEVQGMCYKLVSLNALLSTKISKALVLFSMHLCCMYVFW